MSQTPAQAAEEFLTDNFPELLDYVEEYPMLRSVIIGPLGSLFDDWWNEESANPPETAMRHFCSSFLFLIEEDYLGEQVIPVPSPPSDDLVLKSTDASLSKNPGKGPEDRVADEQALEWLKNLSERCEGVIPIPKLDRLYLLAIRGFECTFYRD